MVPSNVSCYTEMYMYMLRSHCTMQACAVSALLTVVRGQFSSLCSPCCGPNLNIQTHCLCLPASFACTCTCTYHSTYMHMYMYMQVLCLHMIIIILCSDAYKFVCVHMYCYWVLFCLCYCSMLSANVIQHLLYSQSELLLIV